MSTLELLSVALGSTLGGLLRYAVSVWFVGRTIKGFPLSTLLVNLAGAFVLGLVMAYIERNPAQSLVRLALGVGLCGGLTTFSTLSWEIFALLRSGEARTAMLYLACSLAAGLVLCALGYYLINTGLKSI